MIACVLYFVRWRSTSVQTYFKSGAIMWDEKWRVRGIDLRPMYRHGPTTCYYQNGLRHLQKHYERGQLHGTWQAWGPTVNCASKASTVAETSTGPGRLGITPDASLGSTNGKTVNSSR